MSGFYPRLFLTCTTQPSRALCLPRPANLPFLVLIGSPIFLPLILIFPPNGEDLLVPPTERKEGQTLLLPSILVALLICCIVGNSAQVRDLCPACSNSSSRVASLRMVVISACSWSSHRSFLFNNYYPLIVIILTRPRFRHVVRPSVMMILVSSTRSSHTSDESWILTKPPAGITWSRNQVFPNE